MLCKKMGLLENKWLQNKKVDLCSKFKTWKICDNYPNVDKAISLFHFFTDANVWTCNLHHCIIPPRQ
jgi:hypothetical protein